MQLTRGAINLLINSIHTPGWYAGQVVHIYAGGSIVVDVLKEFSNVVVPEDVATDPVAASNWVTATFDIELSDAQILAASTCLTYCVERSILPVNTFTVELLGLFLK